MMDGKQSGRSAFLAGAVAALLFGLSLFLPVATAQQSQGLNEIGGWELLFIGPFGALNGQFAWFATPCLAIAILSLLRGRPLASLPSTALTSAMLLLVADALRWTDYPNDGGDGPIIRYGLGYYAWIAAVLAGCVGLLLARRSASRAR